MPRRGKVKQTQLTFAPVASTPPSGLEHNPGGSPGSSARLRYDRPFKSFLRRGPKIDDYLTRREDLSPDPRVIPKQSSVEGYATEGVLSDDDNNSLRDGQVEITDNSSPYFNPQSKSNGDATPEEDTVMVTTRRQQRNKADAAHDEVSSADTDPVTKAKREGKSLNINGSKRTRPPRAVIGKKLAGTTQETTSGEADSAARQPETSDLESAEPTPSRAPTRIHSPGSDSPEASDADEVVLARPTRRLRRGPAPKEKVVVLDESDESDEEPIVSSPAKRRRRNTDVEIPQTPKRESEQDKLDLEEDLQDLQDSVVKETRTRGRPANSAREKRQQQLEALRRKRTGQRVQSISESEPESEELEPRGSEFEAHSTPQLEEGPLDVTDESAIEPAIPDDENLDRYEDDFVLQDDESIIGVPTDMPFEFSRHAYKQPKEYFRDVVEWMVHNKLNPAFPRSDALYEVAFIKLDDEVKGRIGSQIVSTVWAPGFHRALMARPHIEVTWYPASENHPCDACNRSRHPATFNVHFFGKAYSLQTLEPVSDDEDSDDEDEERDNVERDRDGNVLPAEDTRFLLGRHCKFKATMAHTLSHWRFHLNEWVVDHLAHQGILTDAKILERSHWSVKKQTKYANEVVDMMDRSTEIQKLWRDFHITLKAARETTV